MNKLSIISSLTVLLCISVNFSYAQCKVDAVMDGDGCINGSGSVTAIPSPGANIVWYDSPTGGTALDTGNVLNVNNLPNTSIFYAEAYENTLTPDSINTLTANNGQVSAMFDCKPLTDIVVTGFNFTPRSTATYTARIYYKTGTLVGSEFSSGDWTLLGSTNSFSATSNVLTRIPVTFSQSLQANQTYAFYINVDGATLGYTNGTSLGALAVSNSDIEIYQGRGGNNLFSGSTYTVRTFAGTMLYEKGSLCISTPREPVTLTAHQPLAVDSQTVNDTSCSANSTYLFVRPNGPVLNYTWQVDNGTGTFTNVTGAPFVPTNDTLFINNIPSSLDGAKVRVVMNGLCGDDTSAEMNMVVNAVPTVATPPVDFIADAGDTATFTVTASGLGVDYRWQAGINGVYANINNNGVYTGVFTNTLTVRGVSRAQDGFEYRCVVSSNFCTGAPDTSLPGILYVNFPLGVNNINSNHIINLYPNPANGNTITLEVGDNSKLESYKIIDNTGRILLTGDINKPAQQLDITQLQSGIYFISITDIEGITMKTLRFTKL